jgi:hypothetical protein
MRLGEAIRRRIRRQRVSYKQNKIETREGKDDKVSNAMVTTVPLALADPSPGSLIARLVPSVLTLLTQGPSAAAFLQKRAAGDELTVPLAQTSIHQVAREEGNSNKMGERKGQENETDLDFCCWRCVLTKEVYGRA